MSQNVFFFFFGGGEGEGEKKKKISASSSLLHVTCRPRGTVFQSWRGGGIKYLRSDRAKQLSWV